MANNAPYALGPIPPGPSLNAVAVTAGATVYNPPLTKLWVGGTGNVTIEMPQTGTVTLTSIPAGTMLDNIAILSVPTATATGLVGFW
jgi:hypothetical protein